MNPQLSIRSITVGPLAVNCYLAFDPETRKAAVIDPGGDGPSILETAAESDLGIRYILNTHGHCDHTGANVFLREKTGARIGIHENDAPLLESAELSGARTMRIKYDPHKPDFVFSDGEFVDIGKARLWIMHTPGHSGGCSCFYSPGKKRETPVLFSGDTLFAAGIGRTDLFGGNFDNMVKSLKRLVTQLPPETRVFPGHGPITDLQTEKNSNPYLSGAMEDNL